MKLIIRFCAVALLVFTACKEGKKAEKEVEQIKQEVVYDSFGEKITLDKAITSEELLTKFEGMKAGDTLHIKFASTIKEVCSKKGCWMKLPLGEDKETMVRFKDYGFFMPLDSKGREVVLNGKAFIKETSVKELQHYAEDAGKSKEEIAKITAPKVEYTFEADGVLMKQ
ncbi:DUF4920 domain-containing protein [Polaribacter sp. Hel1_85]|uniref:DUF4920 domain-containing protein n=1 Tax=Polaribacter sp. Hel1_85 TaxID=1250005 RepID=UPI00052CAED7|nr:DUF4920 domain-containing protein [Polaribacter sp. Hel1_85]KGL58936.1 branched-chain amino acid aminotransferase [Polaribacter sp. Hel1_85]